ncbi:hypothetical protein MN116_004522 [Schistosoma mekongi]|uniref:Uncharacterized protein n=1 Tax=Schistosoma mekongi TaxID=38744 RepID=A0AAE2D6K7_SCHME|nr:hypothetical protein MN116_004522 [Schistosoma mekongi]
MASGSRELLRLFAAAIQNASTLAGEMRFIDLSSAFKMTCELQQRVVDLIYSHKKHLTAAEVISRIKQEDTGSTESGNLQSQQQTHGESEHNEQADRENTVNGDESNNSSQEGQLTCNTENINKESVSPVSANNQVNNIFDVLTTNSTKNAFGAPSDRHRLVSIETLYHDVSSDAVDNISTSENMCCKACQLRDQVQVGVTINMVCAACPGLPRICSAQCFRWWHSVHSPATADNKSTSVEPNLSYTKEVTKGLNSPDFQLLKRPRGFKAHTRSLPLLSAAGTYKPDGRKRKRRSRRFTHVKRRIHQETSIWLKQSNDINPITVQSKPRRRRKSPVYINFKDPEWTPYRKY